MNVRPVTTDDDVEMLRVIRNSGRQWMTRMTSEITREQQRTWWEARDPVVCPIWIASVAQTTIGYGLLRRDGGRWWASLAVRPSMRGQGFGTQIYRYLALATPEDVWAEIYADNTASLRAALRAGFQLAYAQDKLAVLVYRKNV